MRKSPEEPIIGTRLFGEEWDPRIMDIPHGYPVYCIYIPTGETNQEFESKLLARLEDWGKNMGENIFVGSLDTHFKTFYEILTTIKINGLKRVTQVPAIVLSDGDPRNPDTFLIVIDDPAVLHNVDATMEIIRNYAARILQGDREIVNLRNDIRNALKRGESKRATQLRDLFISKLRDVKRMRVSWIEGFEVEFSR